MHDPSQRRPPSHRPVAPVDERTASPSDTGPEPSSTMLAVWLSPAGSDEELHGVSRRLIGHYSDPGDLILTEESEVAKVARQLNRRADRLRPSTVRRAGAAVTPLPLQRGPVLVLAALTATDKEQAARIAEVAAARLAPAGFVALSLIAAGRTARAPYLGRIVEACRGAGLRYWQHIIVIDRVASIPPAARAAAPRRGTAPIRSRRVHSDLLVFRRASDTAEAARAAAVEAVAA